MKTTINLIILFAIVFAFKGYSQDIFPIDYKIEKQAMSTPMTNLEEIFFNSSYHTRPINIKFDGSILNMHYDNGVTFINKQVVEVESNANFDEDEETIKRRFFTFNDNTTDTLIFVVDYEVNYVQIILPTQNSKGEKIGYTSYKKYVKKEELAMN